MNVLFFINTYPNYGGVERVTTILANEFSVEGHNVSIVSFNQIDNTLLSDLQADINFYSLSHPVISRENVEAIIEILNKDDIGHIVNQWCLPFYTTLLCKLCLLLARKKAKIYATLHNPTDDYPMTKVLKEKINKEKVYFKRVLLVVKRIFIKVITKFSIRITYRMSDYYILISKKFVNDFQKFSKIKDISKIKIIENPHTVQLEEYNFSQFKKNEIVYVGRLAENKKLLRVLEIWKVLKSFQFDWQLKIVGDGPERGKLESYIKENNLKDVSLLGFQESLIPHYQAAKLFILTSDYEAWGLVIVEAMSYGAVPIVLNSYASASDIVENNFNGKLLNPPFNPNDFANTIMALANNPEKLTEMSNSAQSVYLKYSPKKIAEKWIDLFSIER